MHMSYAPTGERKNARGDFTASPILKFFEKNQTALWHAARLLGGYESARLVDRCSQLLERERSITSRVSVMLNQILNLLSLENAHDPDQPYMGFFVAIDPSDPVVEEICLLVDGLRGAMQDAEARHTWAARQERLA